MVVWGATVVVVVTAGFAGGFVVAGPDGFVVVVGEGGVVVVVVVVGAVVVVSPVAGSSAWATGAMNAPTKPIAAITAA